MDDPNTRGSSALAIMGVFVTLAGIVVALRLYTRFIMLRNPGPEDYTIIVSLVSIHNIRYRPLVESSSKKDIVG